MASPADTLQAYIQGLPPEQQCLLSWSLLTVSDQELHQLFPKIGGPGFEAGLDGSLRQGRGIFGFAIADSAASRFIWQRAGPVYGDPHTTSSKRSEWFGLAGLFEVLTLFATLYSLDGAVTAKVAVCG